MFGARTQTEFEITQALAKGELPEGQAKKLIPAGKGANPALPFVACHDSAKNIMVKWTQELIENERAGVHPASLSLHEFKSCTPLLPLKTHVLTGQ